MEELHDNTNPEEVEDQIEQLEREQEIRNLLSTGIFDFKYDEESTLNSSCTSNVEVPVIAVRSPRSPLLYLPPFPTPEEERELAECHEAINIEEKRMVLLQLESEQLKLEVEQNRQAAADAFINNMSLRKELDESKEELKELKTCLDSKENLLLKEDLLAENADAFKQQLADKDAKLVTLEKVLKHYEMQMQKQETESSITISILNKHIADTDIKIGDFQQRIAELTNVIFLIAKGFNFFMLDQTHLDDPTSWTELHEAFSNLLKGRAQSMRDVGNLKKELKLMKTRFMDICSVEIDKRNLYERTPVVEKMTEGTQTEEHEDADPAEMADQIISDLDTIENDHMNPSDVELNNPDLTSTRDRVLTHMQETVSNLKTMLIRGGQVEDKATNTDELTDINQFLDSFAEKMNEANKKVIEELLGKGVFLFSGREPCKMCDNLKKQLTKMSTKNTSARLGLHKIISVWRNRFEGLEAEMIKLSEEANSYREFEKKFVEEKQKSYEVKAKMEALESAFTMITGKQVTIFETLNDEIERLKVVVSNDIEEDDEINEPAREDDE